MKNIKFGIIGTGRIAGQFVEEAGKSKDIKLLGVSARNYEKTLDFAKKNNIERAYESVEELLLNKDIDAIYVASYHPTHFAYTMKALEAGKHVLCEKPAVLSATQMEKVVLKAREEKLIFMEAMTVGFNPVYKELKKEIAEKSIGEVVHVESSFGRVSTKIHKHNPKQAGGALYDIGIYNIFLLTDILGEPGEVTAISRESAWGVEGSVSYLGKHEGGATSSFYATMDSISGETAKIIGAEGVVEILAPWTTATKFILRKADGTTKEYELNEGVWLGYEIEAFVQTILDGKKENNIMTYENSLILHRTVDKIKKELGLTYDGVEVEVY